MVTPFEKIIDVARSKQANAGRIAIKKVVLWFVQSPPVSRADRFTMAQKMRDYLMQYPIGTSSAYASLEKTPAHKARNAITGRAKGLLEKSIPKSELKVEWATGSFYWKKEGSTEKPKFMCH